MSLDSSRLKERLESFSHWVFLNNQSGRLGGYVQRSPYRTVTSFIDLKHQQATVSRRFETFSHEVFSVSMIER